LYIFICYLLYTQCILYYFYINIYIYILFKFFIYFKDLTKNKTNKNIIALIFNLIKRNNKKHFDIVMAFIKITFNLCNAFSFFYFYFLF